MPGTNSTLPGNPDGGNSAEGGSRDEGHGSKGDIFIPENKTRLEKRRRNKSPSSSSASDSEDFLKPLLPKRIKGKGWKISGEKAEVSPRVKGKRGIKDPYFSDPWQSEPPVFSDDSREEGELSRAEKVDLTVVRENRLFPIDI